MQKQKDPPEIWIHGSLAPFPIPIREHDDPEMSMRFQEAIKKAMQQDTDVICFDGGKAPWVTMTHARAEGLIQLSEKLETMGFPSAIDADEGSRDQ